LQKDPDIINIIVDDLPDTDSPLDEVSDLTSSETAETTSTSSDNEENNEKSKDNVLKAALKTVTGCIKKGFHAVVGDTSPAFIKISCIICIGIIFIAAGIGFLIPKSDDTVTAKLAYLRETDKTYLDAKNDNDSLTAEISSLNNELYEKQQSMNDVTQSQESLDNIKQENDDLKNQVDTLQSEVDTKQRTLDSIKASDSSDSSASVALTSGTYTVGKNIKAGSYNVTGSGSIVISSSGSARVNTKLKSDGASYTLSDGDIIKIDGSAKFIAE
jgi:hypothetical protein